MNLKCTGGVKMSILSMKPHKLFTSYITDGYEDENGYYHEGTEEWSEYMKCDIVPASGKKDVITYEDGREQAYQYTLYLDTDCRDFVYGERVKMLYFGKETTVYKVLGFSRFQHQCKIYVGYDGN